MYEKLSGYRRVPSEYAAADVARAADAILKASRCRHKGMECSIEFACTATRNRL